MRISRRMLVIGGIILIGILIFKIKTVQFYDKEFERIVRETLGTNYISSSDEREKPVKGFILREDIEKVENIYINLNKYRIKNLRDLKKFKNLNDLHLSYVPKEGDPEQLDIPENINSILSLEHPENLTLFRLIVKDNDFNIVHTGVNKLVISYCISPDYNFIEKFPAVETLIIDNGSINSFEFIEKLDSLKTLQLEDNEYTGSLSSLELSSDTLEELLIFSDTPQIFEQLPPIPALEKLVLRGEGVPTREEAEQYYKWENLETISLRGGIYHVKTQTWIENEK